MLLVGCAKMGQPDGGWYDEDPPKILGSSPADKSVNVNSRKVTIFFDEYIKLDNPSEKIVISPPQQEQAEIKGQGKDREQHNKIDLKGDLFTFDHKLPPFCFVSFQGRDKAPCSR